MTRHNNPQKFGGSADGASARPHRLHIVLRKFPFVFAAVVLLSALSVAGAKTIRIAGRATTETGTGASGAIVQLMRASLTGDNTILRSLVATTHTDATGRFVFPAQAVRPIDLFLASVRWQGYSYENIAYVSAGHQKQPGMQANPNNVQVQVYSGTHHQPPLTAMVHHLAVKSDGPNLKCVERFVWDNGSHQTFLGEGPQNVTIRLNLPLGAQNVQIDPKIRDAKLVKTADGWGVAMPIPPGTYAQPALIVNYSLSWPASLPWSPGLDVSKTINYPTNFFFVAREPDDRRLQVTAPTLSPDTEQPLPIGKGTEIRIVNSIGSPQAETPPLQPGARVAIYIARPVTPLFYVLCAFGLGVIILVPATIWGGRRTRHEMLNGSSKTLEPSASEGVYAASFAPSFGSERFATLPAESRARQLIQEIARLDDDWEAGTLDAADYQKQRAARKAELVGRMERDD